MNLNILMMIKTANLKVGMTREEVRLSVGEPDDVGGTSRYFFEPWKAGRLIYTAKYDDDGLFIEVLPPGG